MRERPFRFKLLALGKHWFHASADEVAERVPDPQMIEEMYAFSALERELDEEERRSKEPRPQADPLTQMIAESEARQP